MIPKVLLYKDQGILRAKEGGADSAEAKIKLHQVGHILDNT